MDKIDKALLKLTERERVWTEEIFDKMVRRDFGGLNIKKLKGHADIFRVRKGKLRVIYRLKDEHFSILYIGRRDERTYDNL
jgi:mRNA-degrading endonuclease RelE of RelBE toxin-antitoxin system